MSFADSEAQLEKKAGPLPVWAWGALAGAVLFIIIKRRQQKAAAAAALAAANTTTAPTVDPSATNAAGIDPTTGSPYTSNDGFNPNTALDSYLSSNPTSAAYPVGLTAQGTPAPITDQQWASLAGDYLIGHGDIPSLVENALSKYISGQALTDAEKAIVNQALTAFGTLPEGALPINTVTTPPPGPPKPPGGIPTSVKFPNQTHRVGNVGQSVNLMSYIRQIYPNATAAQQAEIGYATIAAYPQLGTGTIPGGTEVTFRSAAVK